MKGWVHAQTGRQCQSVRLLPDEVQYSVWSYVSRGYILLESRCFRFLIERIFAFEVEISLDTAPRLHVPVITLQLSSLPHMQRFFSVFDIDNIVGLRESI